MIYAWPFFSSQTEVASSFIAFCSRLLSNFKTPGQQTDFSSRVGPYQLQQPSEQILMGVNELFKKHSRVVMVFRVQQLLYSGLGVSILLLYFKTSYKNMMILKSESICHLMSVTDQLTRKTNPFLATSSPLQFPNSLLGVLWNFSWAKVHSSGSRVRGRKCSFYVLSTPYSPNEFELLIRLNLRKNSWK